MKKFTIALAGNPNSGKTTIFNNLTGAHQHVGNYAGVTVEKKEGICNYCDYELNIVDLPGTYSLAATSLEEIVSRDFLIDTKPDVVVVVLDSANLERNLYLAVQLIEMKLPLILLFNMCDVSKARGIEFDLARLSKLLGAPIVESIGRKHMGMDKLKKTIVKVAEAQSIPEVKIQYGDDLEKEIYNISKLLEQYETNLIKHYPAKWLAMKLLDHDLDLQKKITSQEVLAQLKKSTTIIEENYGDYPEIAIADMRYGFISGACQQTIKQTIEKRHEISDIIDAVVTNRILGIPIFLFLMYLTFQFTFTLSEAPMGWLESFFGWLADFISSLWPANSHSDLKALLVDGVIGGVGGVLVFVPNIMLLFLAISLMEDTGYMSRAAFIMDRLMTKVGLQGKSFIPMLTGFGCSVPAIMATRTLENRKDRLITMLVVPLMSCSAKLPIYMLLIPAFFETSIQPQVMFGIYLLGVFLAIICAWILRFTIFKGEITPFVMELPIYRMPTLRGVLIHMLEKSWEYVKKAGTVILAISIILWFLSTYPKKTEFSKNYDILIEQATNIADKHELENQKKAELVEYTLASRVGKLIEPVIKPIGFDWKIGTALIGAFAAKEVFVAQLGIVYSEGETDEDSQSLRDILKQSYGSLVAVCIMVFCLISAPCMATIAVTIRESGSWKWGAFQLIGLTVMAWIVTFIFYNVGMFFSWGVS